MRKNIYHKTNRERLETCLYIVTHAEMNAIESSSCNAESGATDEDLLGRAKDADALAYLKALIEKKLKKNDK
jgi:hypothetical protein